jgi:hypothetical protein
MTPAGSGPNSSVEDNVSLGRDAQNAQERRDALLWCITNPWNQEDIGSVKRLDTANWHGWQMWLL